MLQYKKVLNSRYENLVKRTQVFDCGYLIIWDHEFEVYFNKTYVGELDVWLEIRKREIGIRN